MTGERILYIVLIAVAIGIGIYGSMYNLFRPHVYYECGKSDKFGRLATFYVNEREDYATWISSTGFSVKYDGKVEVEDTQTTYYDKNNEDWVRHDKVGNFFTIVMVGDNYSIATDTWGQCTTTRQFLQRN